MLYTYPQKQMKSTVSILYKTLSVQCDISPIMWLLKLASCLPNHNFAVSMPIL